MRHTAEPVQLAALAAAMVAFGVASRGISAAIRIALDEWNYRAGDLDAWLKRLK